MGDSIRESGLGERGETRASMSLTNTGHSMSNSFSSSLRVSFTTKYHKF